MLHKGQFNSLLEGQFFSRIFRRETSAVPSLLQSSVCCSLLPRAWSPLWAPASLHFPAEAALGPPWAPCCCALRRILGGGRAVSARNGSWSSGTYDVGGNQLRGMCTHIRADTPPHTHTHLCTTHTPLPEGQTSILRGSPIYINVFKLS